MMSNSSHRETESANFLLPTPPEPSELLLLAQNALDDDPQTHGQAIDILVRGGDITLLGQVPSFDIKGAAERAVQVAIADARIHNQLIVAAKTSAASNGQSR
jgi:osmotically-inducible protein OsmY